MPSDNNQSEKAKENQDRSAASQVRRQLAVAIELPIVMVAAVVVGGAIGFFLDQWLHTKPILMLVFGTLGFIGGLREVLRRVSADDDKSQP